MLLLRIEIKRCSASRHSSFHTIALDNKSKFQSVSLGDYKTQHKPVGKKLNCYISNGCHMCLYLSEVSGTRREPTRLTSANRVMCIHVLFVAGLFWCHLFKLPLSLPKKLGGVFSFALGESLNNHVISTQFCKPSPSPKLKTPPSFFGKLSFNLNRWHQNSPATSKTCVQRHYVP